MKKIYHLASCSTNQRILKEWGKGIAKFQMQEIKTEPITPEQIDEMKELAGSFEALFSRVALKYRALGLNEKKLTEKDYRKYILQEYTFLKRPVMINDGKIFIGNTAKVVAAAGATLK
jgi:arsenate reductase